MSIQVGNEYNGIPLGNDTGSDGGSGASIEYVTELPNPGKEGVEYRVPVLDDQQQIIAYKEYYWIESESRYEEYGNIPTDLVRWGAISGNIEDQTDLQDEFDTKQDKFVSNTPLYFGRALVSPATSTEASQSYYSYNNYWTYFYAAGITGKSATYVDGHPYNHLNSIPFEFNKVYKLTSGTYNQYIGSDPLAMSAKFRYYDEYLEKYIPYISFNQDGGTGLVRIPQTADGEPQTGPTGVTVAFPVSSEGSIAEFTSTKDRYVYVQKVKDENDNVKLYVAGWLGWPNWSYSWRSGILKDPDTQDDSKPFSDAFMKCNRIIFCNGNNSNNLSGYEGATYYEIEGTLDQITDVSQLGEAKHYSASQPAVYGDYGLNVGWDRNKIMLDDNNNLTVNESALTSKQDTLVSGNNIKTINNESVLGNGNISLPTVTVDSQLDLNSTNPVENGVITAEINNINLQLNGIETLLNDINSGSGGGN